ncbi:NACHT, LRR and PYD domains-containing protein 12 isoform X2 [Misgurnus anguillicaudatus]|uniref:NACHT, LRR and PYD domains-containing protein 12 isoform X2 n=1 Tax=Misgurnus anguillicaudatus TaxID=75329 RepID=UPI003CCF4C4B
MSYCEKRMQKVKKKDEHDAYQSQMSREASPEPSCVSMKSDCSMLEPIELRKRVTSDPSITSKRTSRGASPEPSCVSMKSDCSMLEPIELSNRVTSDPSITRRRRHSGASPEPSYVSMKSNCSMLEPIELRDRVTSDPSVRTQQQHLTPRGASSEPSCVSMKSDGSMMQPPQLTVSPVTSDPSITSKIDPRRGSLKPSCVSMKSDGSMMQPPQLTDAASTSDLGSRKSPSGASPEFSCGSMKSNQSMLDPIEIRNREVLLKPSITSKKESESASPEPSCVSMKSDCSMLEPIELSKRVTSDPSITSKIEPRSESLEPSCVSMKSDGSMMQPPQLTDAPSASDLSITSKKEPESASSEPSFVSMKSDGSMMQPPQLTVSPVTSDPSGEIWSNASTCQTLIRPNSIESDPPDQTEHLLQDSYQPLDGVLQKVKDKHKTNMKNKYESLFEGIKQQGNQTLLNRIYTQLYIIEGEIEGVNEEHEVLNMEKKPKTQDLQDTSIYCNNIFKPLPDALNKREKIKSVLTKGIAGIGKTVSVQKFILDWADGTANHDVDFIFVLLFRELNLIRDDRYSFHKLLLAFYPELEDLDSKIYDECKVVFIFDGLDESRMALMFSDTSEKVSDVTETSSVSVLMSNLMRGDLLPSSLIWITSRPAAANQIPSKYIKRLTEIQGFNDAQKEEYFRKRISDEHQAEKIISHIRKARSLHIMCHIPVFCWISSTVLQNLLKEDNERAEIPKSLCEMYIHFLLIQMNMKNEKYDERDSEKLLQSNRDLILKLAEVAFKQLMKGNVMFYEEDLRECGIDITDASLHSGICTEIFKEESVIHQRKIYCFIHLSFQEFLAALYGFYYYNGKITETSQFFDVIYVLLKAAVDKALESETGHLDLFLRFLLGISLESNQRLLQDLLTHTVDTSETIKKITEYIKKKINNGCDYSAERSINLLLCLLEVNDQTLSKEIKELVRSDKPSKKLSATHCSTIAYMIQMSDQVMDEFDPKKYNTTQEGRRRLLPAVNNCRKALLADCNLTIQSCEIIASALQSSNSPLRELDLTNNDLQDSGVKLISDALKSPNCQLEILRLSGCMVTDEGCCYLASALSSNPSHLRELDLTYNHPQHSGVQLLSKLNHPNFKLNLDYGAEKRIRPGLQKYFYDVTVDLNTVNPLLMLSEENRKIIRVEEPQSYPDHQERFDEVTQVLCRESLTGRYYWEAEWIGKEIGVSVVYKGIGRKFRSEDCWFGYNSNSWNLHCTSKSYTASHNQQQTNIPSTSSPSNRVGVYLDWPAGILSFYSVSDTNTLTHLHTFNTTFTEPLYAGFRLFYNTSVSLCKNTS